MPAELSTWRTETLTELLIGFQQIKECITGVAVKYIAALAQDPEFGKYILSTCPDVSPTFLRGLEAVGRGTMDGRLLTGTVRFAQHVRRLPQAEQAKTIDGTIDLLVHNGQTLQVKLDSITVTQAQQIFARDHVRSTAEQQTWLASQASRVRVKSAVTVEQAQQIFAQAAPAKPEIEVDLVNNCIVVGTVVISAPELTRYLALLEG